MKFAKQVQGMNDFMQNKSRKFKSNVYKLYLDFQGNFLSIDNYLKVSLHVSAIKMWNISAGKFFISTI